SDGRAGPLLDRLGLVPQTHFDCLAWTPLPGAKPVDGDDDPDDDDGATAWCTGTRFTVDADDVDEFAWLWGNEEDGWVLGRRARGKGGWTVAADFDFLDNDSLSESRNGALAWQVLAPLPAQGTVHLVYSADMPKYYVLLARMGWPILLPLVLALAAWLVSRVERMGPLLPLPPPARRALLDHVRAAGTFAWRRGRGVALHSALLRRVLGAATRRRPELLAMPTESVARALAEDAGVAPEAAHHAIAPTALGQPQEFLSAIRTLTEIDARHDR
ncbi:MAG TPA: hypothetical protein VFL14_13130, partial [Xanthomonadales bacterium]|nr:hypothetical protein [Xanthomonadales bacterium]